jgi:MerR family transcriptional regulator, light-induced transcriptional regulator
MRTPSASSNGRCVGACDMYSRPPVGTTRHHGRSVTWRSTFATAWALPGRPTSIAISAYVTTSPGSSARTAATTSRWNSVSGRSWDRGFAPGGNVVMRADPAALVHIDPMALAKTCVASGRSLGSRRRANLVLKAMAENTGSDAAPDQLVDLTEAARRLGVHYMTAYRYVRTGRLAGVRQDGRWWIRSDEVDRFRPGRADGTARRGRAGRATYRQRLRQRILAGDEPGAWQVLDLAMVAGASPSAALVDVLAPAMRDIGAGWERGELTVGEEHRATAVALRLVGRLGPRFARPGRPLGTVVVAGAPGDSHSLPSAMLATVLRGEGFEVVELGADTPTEAVLDAARAAGSGLRAVGVSVSVADRLPAAGRTVRRLRRAVPAGTVVMLGGPAVPSAARARELGAHEWAGDAGAVAALLRAGGPLP